MKSKKITRFIKRFLLTVIGVCLFQIGRECYWFIQYKTQQNDMKKTIEVQVEYPAPSSDVTSETEISAPVDTNIVQIESKPDMLSRYVSLYEENHDLIGWVTIEGTKIDYPVMQSYDDEYYLYHDFYGEDSKYGCLYVKNQADIVENTNFIIYGHNMKDGAMFGNLDLYMKRSFYLEHPIISFDTLYEERTYEIIAVFQSQVYNADDDVFKYYKFYQAETQEKFNDFYDTIKKLSLYDTGVEAECGDTFLTLSTCAYNTTDGRFVVVAKRK